MTTEPAIIHDVRIDDDLAYLSHYAAGVRIVDVTDPTMPVEVGYYDTTTRTSGFDGCWGVYPFRGDGIFYASDRQNGLFVLEFTGTYAGEIRGIVRSASTSAPIEGASVRVVGVPFDLVSDTAGLYSGLISGGAHTVVTSRFGYAADTASVVVPAGGILVHDVGLVPLPGGGVDLTLTSSRSGLPVPGVVVDVAGTPIGGLVSDGAGRVHVGGLPAGTPWTLRAARFGYAVTSQVVTTVGGVDTPLTIELPPGFSDDFEIAQGWSVGAAGDNATDGLWQRAIPVGSYWEGPVGPAADASPAGDGWAFVTESHVEGAFVATSDVDGGKTTLLSPVFDGTGAGDLTIGYTRWYSDRAPAPGGDPFRADLSTDGGSTWINLEDITVGTDTWAEIRIPLAGIASPTATMQLRFVAEDLPPDTYVEAGVDDVVFATSATAAPPVAIPPSAPLRVSARPNPFRGTTAISFELARSGKASLAVHDVAGRVVATLLSADRLAAGAHRAEWNGRDGAGRPSAPGVYFVRLETSEGTSADKVTLVR